MIALPIDEVMPELIRTLRTHEALVLEAPPGAGKTTRVPSACLDAGLSGTKDIVVLQPRRLATRLAAARVASERGEKLGKTVGYQVRFDDVSSAATRLRFLTEGILTRRLIADPTLKDVGLVVLDEFHERHVAADLALAMIRRLQRSTRPDLKLVVMSATLDAAPIAEWLGHAPRLRSEGRRFEVELEHLEKDDDRPVEQQVLAALKRLLQRQLDGHVLVFLPGAAEIRRCRELSLELASRHGLELEVLHGELSAAEQDRALAPSARRKVILSTNVAETSVTIDGVAAVIDSGLARVAAHSPWSGLPTLKLSKISKASATQRAGRAGRTRAGVCMRLYTRADFEGRPVTDAPEIRRLDFTESALALRALGVTSPRDFDFFEAPAAAALDAAEGLLRALGALDERGGLSSVGQRLLELPLHPRLARVVVEAEQLGVAREGAAIAALLQERDLRLETRARFDHGPSHARAGTSGPSDVLERFDRLELARRGSARQANLDATGLSTVERVITVLERGLRSELAPSPRTTEQRETALLRAVLAGFPDRVAKRRRPRQPELILAPGGSATLAPESVVHDAELMVTVDAEERRGGIVVRVASRIEPEWLLERTSDALGEVDRLEWNDAGRRVERVTRLTWGQVVLDESRAPAPPSPQAAALLVEHALVSLHTLVEPERLAIWLSRIEVVRAANPNAGLPLGDSTLVARAVTELAQHARSMKELEELGLMGQLAALLTPQQSQLLEREAPESVTLPSGRRVKVTYEPGKPPWIESRLQDFFGLTQGPKAGRTPLVLHLLAPNHNAVQVTTDLSGFWERHYPAVRRELMRQYPKHAWPEDPKTAQPPPLKRR